MYVCAFVYTCMYVDMILPGERAQSNRECEEDVKGGCASWLKRLSSTGGQSIFDVLEMRPEWSFGQVQRSDKG